MADPTPMDGPQLAKVVSWILSGRRAEAPRLIEVHEYLKNRVCDIYVPKSATVEYRKLVDQARFNILPLLVSSLAQGLFVDGYRPSGAVDNSPIWDEVWQPNRMDARQAGLYRASLQYGVSYATALPGDPVPVITPWSPRRLTALYDDPINDEWPEYAMSIGIPRADLTSDSPAQMITTVTVYDDWHTYTLDLPAAVVTPPIPGELTTGRVDLPFEGLAIEAEKVTVAVHGLGVCPVVKFPESYDDLDDGPQGIVYPMLPPQRQLNQTTFGLLMAQNYAAFRQRWVTGMAIELDENDAPMEPFNAAVNRVWQSDSPDTKFGDFAETNLGGYLDSRDKTLLFISSARQIPPHKLVVGNSVSNVSAEALAALNDGHQLDIGEHQTAFGESIEQLLRLCGKAMGDTETWEDTSAQVVWRDTTPRSLAQVADALGKLAQQLEVPPEALWEKIPGVTDTDIKRWKAMAKESDTFGELATMLARPEPGLPGAPPAPPGGEVVPGAVPAGAGPDAPLPG